MAVVDTGCDTSSPDLTGQVEAQRDLIDGDDTAQDDHGHGTAMAALIAARSDAAGVVGVAPGVRLLCARVADTLGVATLDRLAAAVAAARVAAAVIVALPGDGLHGPRQLPRPCARRPQPHLRRRHGPAASLPPQALPGGRERRARRLQLHPRPLRHRLAGRLHHLRDEPRLRPAPP